MVDRDRAVPIMMALRQARLANMLRSLGSRRPLSGQSVSKDASSWISVEVQRTSRSKGWRAGQCVGAARATGLGWDTQHRFSLTIVTECGLLREWECLDLHSTAHRLLRVESQSKAIGGEDVEVFCDDDLLCGAAFQGARAAPTAKSSW